MNDPLKALELLEQASNACNLDVASRRMAFAAADLIRTELARLAAYDADKKACVEALKPA